MTLRERLVVWFLLLRCKVRGTHTPMPIFQQGSIFLRCYSCCLRTQGVDLRLGNPR